MSRYAKIIDSKVENVIELDDANIGLMPAEWVLVKSDTANIGYSYVDGEFIAPPQPVIEPTSEELRRTTIAKIEADFKAFLDLRNIDSIDELKLLQQSPFQEWVDEANYALDLWFRVWKAFEDNQPLPVLEW